MKSFKTSTIFLLVIAMTLLCFNDSCKKTTYPGKAFKAKVEGESSKEGDNSKTYLDGLNIKWSSADQIIVSNGADDDLDFELTEGAGSQHGTFYSSGGATYDFTGPFKAVYPAANNSISGTTVTINLPSVQALSATGTFGNGCNPMVAYSESSRNLNFKNVCGGFYFKFKGTGSTTHVSKVELISNNSSEILWGQCEVECNPSASDYLVLKNLTNSDPNKYILTLTCDVTLSASQAQNFYFMLPPHTLQTGMEVKVYDGSTLIYQASAGWETNTNIVQRNAMRTTNSDLVTNQHTTVTTNNPTSIAATTASVSGSVAQGSTPVTARGFCYGTSANPTVSGTHTTDGSGTGDFNHSLTGLTKGTTYHVRAYATTSLGTDYGADKSFTTLIEPTVTTSSVSSIAGTTATGGGNVTATGGANVTERGICWSTSQNPTTSNSHASSGTGTGSYTVSMTGLSKNTTYYVRAYAINSVGTSYGSQVSFKTNTDPTVTTTAVTTYAQTTATLGGNVSADGGMTVTGRGVCWGTNTNPTTSSHTSGGTAAVGSGTGSFTYNATGLAANTTYYVRAYATNAAKGTVYGTQVSFTTKAHTKPGATVNAASNVRSQSVTLNGSGTNGSLTITSRGFYYGTSTSAINTKVTASGSGAGSFTYYLDGLTSGTTYYVKAWTANGAGETVSSSYVSFTLNPYYFSTGSSSKVIIAPGNLVWSGLLFRIAANQYYRTSNANNSAGETGQPGTGLERDLFGWGTNGKGGEYPWRTNTDNGTYYMGGGLNGSGYDWGDNAGGLGLIYNPGLTSQYSNNYWRTPTKSEMSYILGSRSTNTVNGVANARFVYANVNSVFGLIILPDDYKHPSGVTAFTAANINNGGASSLNSYNATQWSSIAAQGAVFLPYGPTRSGTTVGTTTNEAYYWLSSISSGYPDHLYFKSGYAVTYSYASRHYGMMVRLVHSL